MRSLGHLNEPPKSPEAIEAGKRNKPVTVQCPTCAHSWVVAFLPMPLETFAELGKAARCPKGCTAGPKMGGPCG